MPDLEQLISKMPKVELHVHLEGSVRPESLLKLAGRHHISLPADNVDGIRQWYTFRDFDHFIEVYMTISSCLRTAEDIELASREFLIGQADQNIVYSEVTFTPYNQFINCGLGFHEQLDAVNRAREWAKKELGIRMGIIVDIPRERSAEAGEKVAEWVIERYGDGVIALGLGGPEQGNPPSKFKRAFDRVRDAGIPCILHAGETEGPASIWGAIDVADTKRIGHGVRAIEDPRLIEHLKNSQLPLEVCLTSNICLNVYPSLVRHSLPRLLAAGLRITINSDDPPMFNTTLTNEFRIGCRAFEWSRATLQQLVLNAVDAALLPDEEKADMNAKFAHSFSRLGT
jgi:aminodeoxyfutalosine deaminase